MVTTAEKKAVAAAASVRQRQIHRRAALRQHEFGQGPGIFLRRHQRGNPQRAGAGAGPARSPAAPPASSSRASNEDLRVIGEQLGVAHRARRLDPQAGRQRAHHRAADQGRRRLPPVVEDLRPQAHRYLRHPGRDQQGDHRSAVRADHERRRRAARRQYRPGGLRHLPARAPVAGQASRRIHPAGRHPVRSGRDHRPEVRRSLVRPRPRPVPGLELRGQQPWEVPTSWKSSRSAQKRWH